MKFSGDFKRPLSEVQKDREAGVIPEIPVGEDTEILNRLSAVEAENKELKEALKEMLGGETE